jgi:hypothetical protein
MAKLLVSKKNTFHTVTSFLLFTILTITVKAQNNYQWADSTAVWHLTSGSFVGPGYQKMRYEKDTIINNQPCQKIIRYSQIKIQTGPGVFEISPLIYDASYFLYRSNDSIFSYHDNHFFLAFKTNALVGEIWDLGKLYVGDSIQHAYVKVDSVYFESYNGQSLRNIKIHACDMNGDSISYVGPNQDTALTACIAPGYIGSIVNEIFGPMWGFNGINFAYPNFGVVEYMPAQMLCYQDNSLSFIQFQSTDCFNNLFVGINEIDAKEILPFPNPTTNKITINNQAGETLYITDLAGKAVLQKQLTQNVETVNLEDLTNGMYLIRVGILSNKLIKN